MGFLPASRLRSRSTAIGSPFQSWWGTAAKAYLRASCILLYSFVFFRILQVMALKTVTVRIPEDKVKKLDAAARHQQRDRSFVLNEAVDQYLSLQEYHLALIDEGIREADAGHVIPHGEVKKMVASWSRKRKY